MKLPFNVLKLALSIIGTDDNVLWYKFVRRELNEVGVYVNTFEEPTQLLGATVQAVSQQVYFDLGLDWQKNYVMIYTETPVLDLQRASPGDVILWYNKIYQLTSENNWLKQNGWTGVMGVEVEEDVLGAR